MSDRTKAKIKTLEMAVSAMRTAAKARNIQERLAALELEAEFTNRIEKLQAEGPKLAPPPARGEDAPRDVGPFPMNRQDSETSQPPNASGRKLLRVLCADDDDSFALMLELVLDHAGYRVERVADGQQALERITADLTFFDLLLTDHQMPRLSGLRLVKKLRGTAFSGRIIVCSSPLREVDAAAYRGFAVDHILAKPVQVAELLRVIKEMGGDAP